MRKLSFLFLGGNSPWTYGLAEALAQRHHTHAIAFYDWRTYHLLRPTWSSRTSPPLLQKSMQVLPSGYAGRLEKFFRFYLQQLIGWWCHQLKQDSGESPWVIASHPYLAYWVRKVSPERLIYYNFDDYVLYRPNRKDTILKQEKELVERATVTLCASYSQLSSLQQQHFHRADRICHYPHGVIESYLNPQPENTPEPMTVGYVGNLGDRVDWQLVYQVAQACPEIRFVFVGGLDRQESQPENWQEDRAAVLALANVRHIQKVPAEQVAQYYWSCAINWIPYVVKHQFNQASCPTKIMDGIASGRPIVSTDIPECRLYPEWISIFHSAEDAIALIRQQLALLAKTEALDKSKKQLEFARQNTWQMRVQTLTNWLN